MTKKLSNKQATAERLQRWISSAEQRLSKLTDRAVKTKARLLATISKHTAKLDTKNEQISQLFAPKLPPIKKDKKTVPRQVKQPKVKQIKDKVVSKQMKQKEQRPDLEVNVPIGQEIQKSISNVKNEFIPLMNFVSRVPSVQKQIIKALDDSKQIYTIDRASNKPMLAPQIKPKFVELMQKINDVDDKGKIDKEFNMSELLLGSLKDKLNKNNLNMQELIKLSNKQAKKNKINSAQIADDHEFYFKQAELRRQKQAQ